MKTKQPVKRFASPARIEAAYMLESFEPRLLLSTADWRLATGLTHTVSRIHFGGGSSNEVATSVNGIAYLFSQLASGNYDRKVITYSPSSERQRRALVLSEDRGYGKAVAAGNRILFTGGDSIVDIYDTQTRRRSTATLSGFTGEFLKPAAAAVDGLAVFDTGDLYNIATGQWSHTLSVEAEGHFPDAATSVGPLAIFAGGTAPGPGDQFVASDAADIYDADTDQWSSAQLSAPRVALAATTVGHLALFAGGGSDLATATDAVDIYNGQTNQWSLDHLSQGRNSLAATTIGNLALFGGGALQGGLDTSNVVDVFDSATDEWFTTELATGRSNLAATTAGGHALFAGGFGDPNALDVFTAVPGITGSASGKPGGAVNVTVQSTGDAALPAGATVSLYASRDGTVAGATLLGTTTLPAGLEEQASTSVPVQTSLTSVPKGRYHLIAAVDDDTGQGAVVIAKQTKTFTVRASAIAHSHSASRAHPFAVEAGPLHGWPVT
jgi:hypothetical protein